MSERSHRARRTCLFRERSRFWLSGANHVCSTVPTIPGGCAWPPNPGQFSQGRRGQFWPAAGLLSIVADGLVRPTREASMRLSYLFVAALVCASPVSAGGPQKAGTSHVATHQDGVPGSVRIVFSTRDAQLIREHYAPQYRNLPPGLQKKFARTGTLPPRVAEEARTAARRTGTTAGWAARRLSPRRHRRPCRDLPAGRRPR